ncbi:MAG: hypothetical protein Q9160_000491 [Pyrenula sp. 1 TL-2023]
MRYQNWDALIFPQGIKVPLQEFRTQCFVIGDPDGIPLMPIDSSFRISIHSWSGQPKPSKALENIMHTDDGFAFEARVYIDGIYVSGSLMPSNTSWPYVIEQSGLLDKEGQLTPLKFPAFHQEILHQSHWDAGELLGRIRIVIAEGIYSSKKTNHFEHVKDVLAFSFQHAPLHILEYSSIAWPNQSMWNSAISSQSRRLPLRSENEDLHAHSPTRRQDQLSDHHKRLDSSHFARYLGPLTSWKHTNTAFPPPSIPWHVADFLESSKTELMDPFVDTRRGFKPASRVLARSKRSTAEDVPMPDYATSISSGDKTKSRALSHMSGISGPNGEDPIINELNEMYKAFSPAKGSSQGTTAPRNTPTATMTPAGAQESPDLAAQSSTRANSGAKRDGSSGRASDGKRKRTPDDLLNDQGWDRVCSAGGSAGGSARKVSRVDGRSGSCGTGVSLADTLAAASKKLESQSMGAGVST